MFGPLIASISAVAISACLLLGPALAGDGKPFGTWSFGNVTVRVADCGGKLCGTIVSLGKSKKGAGGIQKLDRMNPNPARRNRSLVGMPVLLGMKPSIGGEWQGIVYNPQDGKTYNSTISVVGDTLTVNGCIGGVLCKSRQFARK
jgi:uncharacterized protein (DUF2147 family)